MAYLPGAVPENVQDLPRHLTEEQDRIADGFNNLEPLNFYLPKQSVAPSRPRDGQVEYADGTNWNPGSGAGIYYFNGSTWNFLG